MEPLAGAWEPLVDDLLGAAAPPPSPARPGALHPRRGALRDRPRRGAVHRPARPRAARGRLGTLVPAAREPDDRGLRPDPRHARPRGRLAGRGGRVAGHPRRAGVASARAGRGDRDRMRGALARGRARRPSGAARRHAASAARDRRRRASRALPAGARALSLRPGGLQGRLRARRAAAVDGAGMPPRPERCTWAGRWRRSHGARTRSCAAGTRRGHSCSSPSRASSTPPARRRAGTRCGPTATSRTARRSLRPTRSRARSSVSRLASAI